MVDNTKIAQLYEWGVKLYIGGNPATPDMVGEFIISKSNSYMPIFVYDKDGNLDEIRY